MNKKKCIFNENSDCTDCGECEVCDLDKNKICDNCGKCLEADGTDSRSIMIDKIVEDPEEIAKIQSKGDYDADDEGNDVSEGNGELLHDYDDDYVKSEEDDIPLDVEFIDDVDGLDEILEDDEKRSKITDEKYPGFFVIKKNNK